MSLGSEMEPRDASPADNDSTGSSTIYLVLAAILLTLIGGFLLKGQCLQPWDGIQYSNLCYNDIQPLYGEREIQRGTFPYVSGDPSEGGISGGALEYPVLTGLFMWLMGRFVTNDVNAYLIVTVIGLAPFGIYTAFRLARMTGTRALLWAAAPAIVLYAFHNWDLLVVAATVAGLGYWHRERPLAAAIMFGIGGALKMYPLMFLAPLVLYEWRRLGWKQGRQEIVKVAVAGVSSWLLFNLPFMLINFDGWLATYKFHGLRPPNYDTIWAIRFSAIPIPTLNLLTGVLTILSFVAILFVGWRRGRKDGEYPFLQVSAALMAAFLLWNKVHSPQYTLWLLPFFVMLRVHFLWWLSYTAADVLVYIGVFRFFYAIQYFMVNPDPPFTAMRVGVYARALLLAALIVVFLTSRRADRPEEVVAEPVVSHPPPTLQPVGEQAPA